MWTTEQAWAAVVSRDRSWDGRLVYAVETTGVYCRPSCASARPRRRNVAFYEDAAAAEAAGYRACLRCTPADPGGDPATRAVKRAQAHLEAAGGRSVTLAELGRVVGMSPSHLQRQFTRLAGMSPREWQRARRVEAFKQADEDTVLGAQLAAGYGSSRALYENARSDLGMTPAQWHNGGEGVTIHYTTTKTRLGALLVAGTADGVCAVSLGDAAEPLIAALRDDFPRAEAVEAAPGALAEWVSALVAYVEGEVRALGVPIVVDGTDFQRRVWAALRRIPYGETWTYSQLAEAVGSGPRAVAQACARNRIALAIPCHRIVRKGGDLSGYRWGPPRKAALLAMERDGDDVS